MEDEDLLITPTDKNLGIALISKQKFKNLEQKELEKLKINTIDIDPNILLIKLRNCILRLVTKSNQFPNNSELWKFKRDLSNHNGIPIFKGILKIHKKDLAVRPVVRENAGPIYILSKKVANLLKQLLEDIQKTLKTKHITQSSTEIAKALNEKRFQKNGTAWVLITADVKSMYPSFDKSSIHKEIVELTELADYNEGKKDFINRALKLILFNNYFTDGNKIYKATTGIATGDPTSVLLASLAKVTAEVKLIRKYGDNLPIFYRYVDDILAIINFQDLENFKLDLNEAWSGFELELEENFNKCNFLDLTIYRNNDQFKDYHSNDFRYETKIFQKEKNLYQYLNWKSDHPREIYKGIYIGELYRYIRASSQQKEYLLMKKVFRTRLRKRGWPLQELIKFDKFSPNFANRNSFLNKRKKKDFKTSNLKFNLTFTRNGIDKKKLTKILKSNWDTLPEDLINKFPEIRYKLNRNFSSLYTF
jgi:hypothetical protein